MPEVITHEHTGFIVPPNDSVTLGRYIEKLATDLTLAAAIGRAGKRVAEQRYTWDAAARRCLEGYRTLGA
jgi:glycosyltransferase involved in cell wall biosynthesis